MARTKLERLRQHPLIREGAPLLGLYWSYSAIRWLVAREGPYEAFENAFKIIQLEKQLAIFHEPTIQQWLIKHAPGVVKAANSFYTFGYFPILILTAVLLYRFDSNRYQIFKLTFMLGLGFALIGFSLFPLAPPRMLPEVGFVDTQQLYSDSFYNNETFLSFYNPYAAMPSLHFGWTLLVGIIAYTLRHPLLKILGVLYPCTMAFVVVVTGHHYWLDVVGGCVVVGLTYSLVRVFLRATGSAGLDKRYNSRRTSLAHQVPLGRESDKTRDAPSNERKRRP
jgi:membrane-associated phospholipid phosphatase